jgi:hypothetical protein
MPARTATLSRSVNGMSWIAWSGAPAEARAAAIARFEWMASLPPRRMVALPVLKQSTAASAVTFGRLS